MILVMFSGGLDSTGALWQLFKQGQTHLHIHHMRLKNVENRFLAEDIAVRELIENIKTAHTFTESTHEYPRFNGSFMFDGDISSFMAGSICNSNRRITKVAFGKTATDVLNPSSMQHIQRANGIFEVMCHTAKKIYPIEHLTKREVWDYLPEAIRSLTWSCRRPLYKENKIKQCEKCRTCREMREYGIPHRTINQ